MSPENQPMMPLNGFSVPLELAGLSVDAEAGIAAEEDKVDLYEELMSDPEPPDAPGPVNWNILRSHELKTELLELDQWVDWLRRTYGLSVTVVPPFWHRHPELLWELSALRSHWLSSFDPRQAATGPLAWHKEFAAARLRLREWVANCGTRIDSDRPTRQSTWPGETPQPALEDEAIPNRRADFQEFLKAAVELRERQENEAMTLWFGISRPVREPGNE